MKNNILILAITISSSFFIYLESISCFILYIIFNLIFLLNNKLSKNEFIIKYFNLYVILSIILNISFIFENGTNFIDGNDDQAYYNRTMHYLNNVEQNFEYYNFKGFIWLLASFYKILNYVGLHDNSFFIINILSAFAGTFVLYFTDKVLNQFQKKNTNKTIKRLALFPLFFIFAITGLRDIWLILITISYFYYSIIFYESNSKILNVLFIKVILLVCAYFFRPVNLFFLLSLDIGFYLFDRKNKRVKQFFLIPILLILFFSIFFVKSFPISDLGYDYVLNYIKMYNQFSTETAGGGSIGIALRQSTFLPFKFLWIIYTFFSPFPPPAIYNFSFYNIIISLGSLIWLVLMPVAMIKIFNVKKKQNSLVFQTRLFFIFVILATSFTSGNFRHLSVLYPFIFILYSILPKIKKNQAEYFLFSSSIAFCTLFLTYLVIKIF